MSDSVAGPEKVEDSVVECPRAETTMTDDSKAVKEDNADAKTAITEAPLVEIMGEEKAEAEKSPAEHAGAIAASEEVEEKHPATEIPQGAESSVEAKAEIHTASFGRATIELPTKETGTSAAVLTPESSKTEPTPPSTPRKPQKAAFNIDAKPFSPVSLSDPTLQATLVGETNGLSIKIGQWSPNPFVPAAHLSPTAPVNVAHIPYVAPVPAPAPAPVPAPAPPLAARKETTSGKDSLSAYAKPWSPHPEMAVPSMVVSENEVAIHPGSWSAMTVDGKEVVTPSPMITRKSSTNLFAHSVSVHPKGLKTVELELFNYTCGRCTLRTLYGRLSSRQPDVTMRNISVDVPPLCVAHLIEQITKAKVTALHLNESEGTHYDIWLDKPNLSAQLVESISGSVWAAPMHHGYAVMGKNEEGKRYLRNYVERLRDSKPVGGNVYDVGLVEVKEH
ncbi:hypothetical protein LSCM1_05547 [Leishmania martiniquensis]|uniref:Uncharacterized protein n=1 Tax=Leishmania martiniquensis TaxID=1580590 RepID=A0A836HRY4_9TRYP|nr:hypothetical protein LSCM1_05547 [Leishmania martiniquensis]